MKVEPVRGPKFAALVKKFGSGTPSFSTPVLNGCDANDPLAILLSNYLLWESTPALLAEALERVARVVVDVNDLRVMLEREVVEVIGEKYPFVEERALRLRATLNDIFRRQHRTSLDHLRNASRKDQRAYLEGLAEIPPFVAGRTLLVAFELPAPIADDTAVELLHQHGAVEPAATTVDVVQWIGRTHRIEELPKVHDALSRMSAEAWTAAGKNGHKIRGAYLSRHAGFRAAEEAERQRVEEEKLAKIREAERLVEEKRLAEVAREQERQRQKLEAEQAKVRARAEREAARLAAIADRERKIAAREADRVAREAQRAKEEARRQQEAEKLRLRREAAAKKAELLRAKREKKAAEQKAKRERKELAQRLKREKALAAKQKAAEAARKKAELKSAALKKAALQKAAMKQAAAKKAAAAKASSKKSAPKKAASKKAALKNAASAKASSKASSSKASSKTAPAKRSVAKPTKARPAAGVKRAGTKGGAKQRAAGGKSVRRR
ncbi:MAG: hypothetical protein ACOYMM_01395 [Phycisphaerales bacterium]